MSAPLLTTADRAALLAARVAAIRVLAVGGESWAITRRTGDGIAASPVGASAGTATGLLYRTRAEGQALALPAVPVGAATWQFLRTGGAAVQEGDELAGAGGVMCRVASRTALVIGETWEASRL